MRGGAGSERHTAEAGVLVWILLGKRDTRCCYRMDTFTISSSERSEIRQPFYEWSSIQSFEGHLSEVHDRFGDFVVTERWLQFWREGWVGLKLALEKSATEIRICADNRPDFELRLEGCISKYEVSECFTKGRRRTDEYREDRRKIALGEGAVRHIAGEDWLDWKKARSNLLELAEKKASKPYSSDTGLVIYLNDSDFDSDKENIERSFVSATAGAAEKFSEVWILWSDKLYRTR